MHNSPVQACLACGNFKGNQGFSAREQALGLGDEFAYQECAACGSLQLLYPPADLARYYPADYYSFAPVNLPAPGRLMRWLKRQRTLHALGWANPLGQLLARVLPLPAQVGWVPRTGLGLSARILDVGCGAGETLKHLSHQGFSRLTGIDPLLPGDLTYEGGVRVYKRELSAVSSEYDLVMFNHSLEHLPEPIGALIHSRGLLAPGGWMLVRLPVAGGYAWRHYGAHWVQLDAPRHRFIPSEPGLRHLAAQAGLKLRDIVYDSTALQFWGSEQYRRNVPLYSPQSYLTDPAAAGFTSEQIAEYEQQAAQLNARADGDQACFYLQRAG